MPTVVISNADIQSAAVNNNSSVSASITDKLTSSSSSTTSTTTAIAPRETLATINAKLVSSESVSTSTVATTAITTSTSTLKPNSRTDVASERMMVIQSTVKTVANSNFKGSSGSRSTSENNNHNGSSEGFLTPNIHHNNNNSRQRISAVKVTLPPGGVKGATVKNSKINAPPGLNYVFDAHPNINKHHHHDYR